MYRFTHQQLLIFNNYPAKSRGNRLILSRRGRRPGWLKSDDIPQDWEYSTNCISNHMSEIYRFEWPVYFIPRSASVTLPTLWTSQTTPLNLPATLMTTSLINTPTTSPSRSTDSQSLPGSSLTQGKNSSPLYTAVHCWETGDDNKQSHQLELSAASLLVLRIWPV